MILLFALFFMYKKVFQMRKNTFICAEIWMFSGEWPIYSKLERGIRTQHNIKHRNKKTPNTYTQEHDYEMKKRKEEKYLLLLVFFCFFFLLFVLLGVVENDCIQAAHNPRERSPHKRAKKKALACHSNNDK